MEESAVNSLHTGSSCYLLLMRAVRSKELWVQNNQTIRRSVSQHTNTNIQSSDVR